MKRVGWQHKQAEDGIRDLWTTAVGVSPDCDWRYLSEGRRSLGTRRAVWVAKAS